MKVSIYDYTTGAKLSETSLAEFYRDNDSISPRELDQIERDLTRDGTARVGGGAAPVFILRVI